MSSNHREGAQHNEQAAIAKCEVCQCFSASSLFTDRSICSFKCLKETARKAGEDLEFLILELKARGA